jgi:hypothetical protein
MKCRIVAVANFGWDPQNSEELQFREGDILLITDDNDPDWWTGSLKPIDTFQEIKQGLVPVTYITEMAPLYLATALYDYHPATDDEIQIREGDLLRVYEIVDSDWLFVKQDDNIGLVPFTYVEKHEQAQEPQEQDPELQKNRLITALDGFGFTQPRPSAKKEAPIELYGPDDVTYYNVTVPPFNPGD